MFVFITNRYIDRYKFIDMQQILELVNKTLVENVLTFHLPAWYGHLNCRSKNKLSRIVLIAAEKLANPKSPQFNFLQKGR